MTAYIGLTRGQEAAVDARSLAGLARWRWSALRNTMGGFYAVRGQRVRGKQVFVYMHRQVLGAKPGQEVDHRNHDTLDNRRSNLRIATRSQNCLNRLGAQKNSKTGVRGVSPWRGKFRAVFQRNHIYKQIGVFKTIAEARRALKPYHAAT